MKNLPNLKEKSKSVTKVVLTLVVVFLLGLAAFMATDTQARPFEGYGDFGQPPIVEQFYLNEAGSAGITSDNWVADLSNIRINYRVLSIAGIDKVYYGVYKTAGDCDITNASMNGECILSSQVKNLYSDVTQHDGVEGEEYNRPIEGLNADGTYAVILSVSSGEGILNGSETLWFGIDKTVPDAPVLISPANNIDSENNSVVLEWSNDNDDVISYEIMVNDQVYTSDTKSLDLSLATGAYTWKVRAQDKVGNMSEWSGAWTFNLVEPAEEPQDEEDSDEVNVPEDLTDKSGVETPPYIEDSNVGEPVTSAASTVATDAADEGVVAGEATATEEEVVETEDSEGEVQGVESGDLKADAATQAETSGFAKLMKSWLFWVIVAILVALAIWLSRRRKKDEEQIN